MTLSTRNTILRLGLAVSALVAGAATAAAVWLYLSSSLGELRDVATDATVPWIGLDFSGPEGSLAWVAGRTLVTSWFAVVALGAMLRQFRRTTAPEMFFFSMFLVALSFDSVRLLQVVHDPLDLPILARTLVSRVAYFGHTLGIFCLFGSSLYAVGVEYQRTGAALSIAALIAFAFAYAVPVDPTVVYPNLLSPIGNQRTVQVVAVVLNVLVLSNFLYARFAQDDRGYFVLLAAMLGITAGNELLFYAVGPTLAVVGTGAVVVGALVFWRQIHAMYLWIS